MVLVEFVIFHIFESTVKIVEFWAKAMQKDLSSNSTGGKKT